MKQVLNYAQLEQGARYLAARATTPAERHEHLGWANRYCRLRSEGETCPTAPILRAAA